MAKCNQLTTVHFKGLNKFSIYKVEKFSFQKFKLIKQWQIYMWNKLHHAK